MNVTSGTGAFQGAKATGVMTCSSSDGIHTSCTDKLDPARRGEVLSG